ncbi:MAG: zinc carboxypeptidase [Planctomycetes bacterium]|nr:zinc carboxypeptidase [Planctomycetota bacterium]
MRFRHLALSLAGAVVAVVTPCTAQTGPARATSDVRHLVHVFVRDARTLAALQALELDLAGCTALELPAKEIEVIASDDDLVTLANSGLEFEIAIRDLAAYYARQLAGYGGAVAAGLTPPIGQGGMGGHYTLAQMEAILDSLHQRFPALCSQRTSIGRSHEGRDLWMVKISDNVGIDENEPEVFYDAVHHAREPLSMTTTLQLMVELLEGYGTDPEATFLIDERELFFVPCVNPDGYEYNRQIQPGGGGMWRKNRRNNGDGTYGVDLNRNYATGWSAPNGGNSTQTSSDVYRGPAPFSEPESAAVEAFLAGRSATAVLSCHTYQEVLLRPWGYQPGDPANVADYDAIGDRMTQANGMAHGSVSGLLYIAAGGSVDHHHAVRGSVTWTPELGRSNEGGFWPTPPLQIAISQRHQRMFRELALTAGALLDFGTITVTEAPGGNGNGRVEPGESGLVTLAIDNAGLGSVAAAAGLVTLQATQAGVSIPQGSFVMPQVARLGSVSNAGNPLVFALAPTFADPYVTLRLTLTGDGRTTVRDVDVVDVRELVATDMETDHGLARDPVGTATTGRWERAAPQQTTSGGAVIQPGNQATPGGSLCWITDGRAGTSAGTYDVDGGYTDLVTPAFDLRHVIAPELRFRYWFVDSTADDPFDIAVSADGGSWQPLATTRNATTAWSEWRIPLAGVTLGASTRFRFRAQDLNASLVEAGLDDLGIWGAALDGDVTLLGSGVLGTTLRVGIAGAPGAQSWVLLGPALAAAPIPIPGIAGALRLDPGLVFAFGAPPGAGGIGTVDLQIPVLAGLSGAPLHFQGLHQNGAALRLGNLQSTVLR